MRVLEQIEGEAVEIGEGKGCGGKWEGSVLRFLATRAEELGRRTVRSSGRSALCRLQSALGFERPREPYAPLEQRERFPFPFPWGSLGRERETRGSSKGSRS